MAEGTRNGIERVKSGEEEEDRISSLPDSLIHHILSFLPATDLVKTSVLSKWWNYQWTHVPVLKFIANDGMSLENFSSFVDRTLILHDCSNLHKFKIKFERPLKRHDYTFPNLNLWIRFACRKDVKELTLMNYCRNYYLSLPEFVFNDSSLVKLKLTMFTFEPSRKVNWGSVKSLRLYECEVGYGAIENALSGSPLLEHLELHFCDSSMPTELVIASKRLKTLILDGVDFQSSGIEVSCTNLERLMVLGPARYRSIKLENLPSSVYATLDFVAHRDNMSRDDCINLIQQTLRQVKHVEKLEIGSWLMEWRSCLERSTKEGIEDPR